MVELFLNTIQHSCQISGVWAQSNLPAPNPALTYCHGKCVCTTLLPYPYSGRQQRDVVKAATLEKSSLIYNYHHCGNHIQTPCSQPKDSPSMYSKCTSSKCTKPQIFLCIFSIAWGAQKIIQAQLFSQTHYTSIDCHFPWHA